jgi:hypothetical protein
MKKFVTPVLMVIIIVLGAYILFNNYIFPQRDIQNIDKEEDQSILLQKELPEDSFTKKKECASHQEEIMQDILNPTFVYNDSDPVLEEIFYSPERNSCLYVFRYYWTKECSKLDTEQYFKWNCQNKIQQIEDFFTKETVYDSTIYDKCYDRLSSIENANPSSCMSVSRMIDRLKKEN